MAEELGERAICVILSGTGGDGSLGLKAVKEKGGLVIVQRSLIEMAPHSPARTRARASKKTQRYLPSAAKSPPMPMPW